VDENGFTTAAEGASSHCGLIRIRGMLRSCSPREPRTTHQSRHDHHVLGPLRCIGAVEYSRRELEHQFNLFSDVLFKNRENARPEAASA